MRSLKKVPLDQIETNLPDRALSYSSAVSFNELIVGDAFYGKDNKWHIVLEFDVEYPRVKGKHMITKPEIFKTFDGKLWTSIVTGGKYDNDVVRDVYLD